MATANGNTVSGGSTSAGTAYSWRCVVEIAVASETATSVKYTVRLKYYTRYAIDVYSSGRISGGASGSWSDSMKSTSNSGKTVTVITKTVTVSKGSSSKSFSVYGQIKNTGGFGNGTSKATCKVTVPASDYSAPNAPSSCAASRSSDSQAKVTWRNGSTSTTRPRSSTKVERQTDSGSWTQIASVGSSTKNYTDNGISANRRYRYRVRAYGSGGYSGYSTSGYIYTTPAAPTSVGLVKTSDTQVQVAIQGAAPWADSYKLQRSVDSGSWVDVASVTSWPYVDTPGGGMVRYRVAAVRGSLQSAWTESAEIATITPPNAPSVALSPANAVLPVGTAVNVSWTPDHPDGSAQSGAQVEYTVAGSASTATVTGAASTYALPATALDAPATVSVRVRTKGLDPDWGAWSSPAQLTLAYPPSVSISVPGIDGASVSDLPLTARWAVEDPTGVAEQQLRLYEDGALVHSAQLPTDARSYEFGDSTYRLGNHTPYSLELTVRGGSSLSTAAVRTFATEFAQPEPPEAIVGVDYSDMSASVEVHAGPSESDEGPVVEVDGRGGTAMSGLVVYGATRQNLWTNPATGTSNGVTLTANANGSVTVDGTATNTAIIRVNSYVLKPGAQYTISVDKQVATGQPECGFGVEFYGGGSPLGNISVGGNGDDLSESFTVPDGMEYVIFRFRVPSGVTVSGTYRVMLNEGTEAEPWCPPGLNSVEELSIVTAGKNLLARMGAELPYTTAGITFSDNGDGGIRVSGTATSAAYYDFFGVSAMRALRITPGTYVASLVGAITNGINLNVGYFDGEIGADYTSWLATNLTGVSNTGSIDRPVYLRPFISIASGRTVNTVLYPQLERGSTATAYELPAVTTTPIDLDGHALNSLPDGTRDELRVDEAGAVTLVQRVGYVASYTNQMLGDDIIASAYDEYGLPAQGATVIWRLATEQEIDLGTIAMPVYGSDSAQVFASSDVPATLRVLYPAADSLTVERMLPDGSRWTVATGLADGQECIDPLPPLNLDYQYLVTASTDAGAAATTNADARVDSTAAAFNFGSDASTCELLRLDPSWSRSPSISTELYDFADGGEAGGLPVAYTTDSLSVSGSESAATLGAEQYRRLMSIARTYAVGWVRDQLGGRQYCALAWSFSGSVPYSIVQCSVDMNEIRWREAW